MKDRKDIECIVCGNNDQFSTHLKGSQPSSSSPYRKAHPNYFRCCSCGLVFAHPIVPVSYGNRDEYFRHKGDFALYGRLRNYEMRYDAIIKHLANIKSPSYLDIGTHTGIFLKLLKDKGLNAVGLELNEKAAQFGREQFDVEIISDPAYKLTNRGPFDVVSLFNVFEHLVDPISVLSQIRNLTSRNGLLVLELPYIFTPQAALFRGRWHHYYPEHFWFYDKKSISMLLAKHGFEVLETSFVPKVVTVAWIVYMVGFVSGMWRRFPRLRARFLESAPYRELDRILIKVNLRDYLLVIARCTDPGT
jgi:SAM-dependent methyltransferase